MTDKPDPTLINGIVHAVKSAIKDFRPPALGMILRIGDVAKETGRSVSTIRNMMDSSHGSYDPSFPLPRELGNGAGKRSSIGWLRTDIEDWVNSRPVAYPHQVNRSSRAASHRHSRAKKHGRSAYGGYRDEPDYGYISNGQVSDKQRQSEDNGSNASDTDPSKQWRV